MNLQTERVAEKPCDAGASPKRVVNMVEWDFLSHLFRAHTPILYSEKRNCETKILNKH